MPAAMSHPRCARRSGGDPAPGLGNYRTPVEGIYLSGAGTHPGSSVSGAPGRACARVILDDVGLAGRRLDRPRRVAGQVVAAVRAADAPCAAVVCPPTRGNRCARRSDRTRRRVPERHPRHLGGTTLEPQRDISRTIEAPPDGAGTESTPRRVADAASSAAGDAASTAGDEAKRVAAEAKDQARSVVRRGEGAGQRPGPAGAR